MAGPTLPPAISSLGGGASPRNFAFGAAIPVGKLVSVLVGDGFGFNNAVTAISDTAGNTYTLDVAVNQVAGDGSIYVAHTKVTHAISTSDSLIVAFNAGSWTRFWVVATAFDFAGGGAADPAGAPAGIHWNSGTPTGSAAITPAAVGDLLIGYAVYEFGAAASDPAHGWTTFLTNVGDANNSICAGWQIAPSTAPVPYTTSSTSTGSSGGGYGATVAMAYAAAGGGGGGGGVTLTPGTITTGAPLSGIVQGR